MPNDKDDKPEGAARPKRPNTIDLTATEIKAAAAATGAANPAAPKAAASDKAAADKAAGTSAETSTPTDAKPIGAPPASTTGSMTGSLPWPMIGAAAAAATLFFAVGLGAGHILFRGAEPAAVVAPQAVQPAQPNPEWLDRLAKLEAAIASRQTDPQLLARIAAAEAAVKTAADIAAARERRSDEIASMARDARDRAASAASAADDAVQKARAASGEQPRIDLDTLTGRIAALESASRASQAELARRAADAADDKRGRLAIAALALRASVESGVPFAAELAAVKALGGEAKLVATLEPFAAAGIPTAATLSRELSAAMPSIWKAARANEPVEGTFLERLQANAEKIVRVRPAGDVAGDDAASVKARIELRAGSADIRGALAELSKLPAVARAPADAWIRKAQARDSALAAARALSDNALGALAKSGS